jgi:hypothetical protein
MDGDRVRVGFGHLFQGNQNIPIYKVEVNEDNCYVVDEAGLCSPKVCGGVRPGSTGHIDGHPVKAVKTKLYGYDKVPALGQDIVLLYPIFFDDYRQTAWVSADHFSII